MFNGGLFAPGIFVTGLFHRTPSLLGPLPPRPLVFGQARPAVDSGTPPPQVYASVR
jgi:hypothetical protein